jgi:hypothetical protein
VFIPGTDDRSGSAGDHEPMPSAAPQSVRERLATRRAIIAFVVMAAIAVAAFLGARAVARDDGAGTPAHTVRDFLVAAVAQHNGVGACRYLTLQAVREVAAAEPRDTPCQAALAFARLSLDGRDVRLESTIKGLAYAVDERGDRARVTVGTGRTARAFVLRRATRQERIAFQAPPTPWRIDAGVVPLVRR